MISVVVTLLVYWLAEEYAEVLGEQVQGGRLPSRASIWGALAATWPMVTASYAPLLALVLARLGERRLRPHGTANVGLAAAIVLLTFHGWLAARAAQLRSWQLFFATSIAAALGLVMIAPPQLRPDPPSLKSGPGRTRVAVPLTSASYEVSAKLTSREEGAPQRPQWRALVQSGWR